MAKIGVNKIRAGVPAPSAIFLADRIEKMRARSSKSWLERGKKQALALFARTATEVPAYKNFLAASHIKPAHINSFDDFAAVSTISKSYIREHSAQELMWHGTTATPHIYTATSGSTGKPAYFARSKTVDQNTSLLHELFFRSTTLNPERSTLVVDCFGMGIWIGGLITYEAFERLQSRGYPFAIITPGINKTEIFKALKELLPNYDQLILIGYPPFIKDIVDEAGENNVTFENKEVALLFAAEAFTESFREYLAEKVGISNLLANTANIYGTAELGAMAIETPLSILIRRLALANRPLFERLFGPITKTPTLAQFNPESVLFEGVGGNLIITGDSAMPLVRYALGDQGNVHTFDEIERLCGEHGIDLVHEMTKAGMTHTMTKLPFVHVYERADLSTTLYGLLIYPETIKEVLLRKEFASFLTGKLALVTRYNESHDQYLEVNIELRPDAQAPATMHKHLAAQIVENLREKNAEFSELWKFVGERALPKLVFWPNGDPQYFKPGVKQKWVVKESK
ncbi:MAG: phenylacetate--CoA ligase family protein [Minisyncoccia bacterium]